MTRDFQEVLSYYKEKFRGKPEKWITDIALSAWKNVKIDKANREMGLIQEEMARRGLRHETFRWIYETDKAIIGLNKKYKLNIKTKPISCLIGNTKLKIIIFVIASKILNKIVSLHNSINNAMYQIYKIEHRIK